MPFSVRIVPAEGANKALGELVQLLNHDDVTVVLDDDLKGDVQYETDEDEQGRRLVPELLFIGSNPRGLILSADEDHDGDWAWRHVLIPWPKVIAIRAQRSS